MAPWTEGRNGTNFAIQPRNASRPPTATLETGQAACYVVRARGRLAKVAARALWHGARRFCSNFD